MMIDGKVAFKGSFVFLFGLGSLVSARRLDGRQQIDIPGKLRFSRH